jgi:hypothetical protein
MLGAIPRRVHLATRVSILAVVAGCSGGARQPMNMSLSTRLAVAPRIAQPAPPHIDYASVLATPAPSALDRLQDARDCIRTGCGQSAVATIAPVRGHHAKGTVTLAEVDGGLEVKTSIDGLSGRHVYSVRSECTADRELVSLGELRDTGNITAIHSGFLEGAALATLAGATVVVIWEPDNPYLKHRAPTLVACGVIAISR